MQGKLLEKFIKKLDLSLDKIYKIIGIIGGTDGSTEIYTEKKEDNDKNEGIEITSGTDGLTEIYTDKE